MRRKSWVLPKEWEGFPVKKGIRVRTDGEPRYHELLRFKGDSSLMTHETIECCGCGLTHVYAVEVFRAKDGRWWLVQRAYGVAGTGPEKRRSSSGGR